MNATKQQIYKFDKFQLDVTNRRLMRDEKPVTNFKSNYLEDFAWSPDGTKLAVSRSLQVRDVVLIEKVE